MTHDYKKMFRSLRTGLNLSQAKFGKLIGANRDKIASYEHGRCKPPADILMAFLALRDRINGAVKE